MSLQQHKTNPELGLEIHKHLYELGLETPMFVNRTTGKTFDIDSVRKIEKNFREIMETLGLDLTDDSLIDTPRRVAKMYVNEIFWGLDYKNFPKCTTIENKMKVDEMIIERNINVQSNCEHHFVVIDGTCDIAYIPQNRVLGLSKLNRVVEFFSKRPQVQERLTGQIFHALCFILGTEDVAVRIKAQHYCVKSRGVEDVGSDTVTSKLGGVFKTEPEARTEFLSLIR